MKKTVLISLLASAALFAENGFVTLEPIIITYKNDTQKEQSATYSADFYDAKEISSTGAKDIYELLRQSGFVNTAPSYGSKFSYLTDIRGYGIEKGSQNVGIFIDGERRRSIDLSPIVLTLPLEAIKSVEVARGGGSLDMMDGANAGSIKIKTKEFNGANAGAEFGNYGYQKEYGVVGVLKENYSITAGTSLYKPSATRDMPGGEKDDSLQKALFLKAKIRPTDSLEFGVQKESTDSSLKYSGAIDESLFKNSPEAMGNWSKERKYKDRNGAFARYENRRFANTLNIFEERIKSRSNSAFWSWGGDYKNKGFEYDAKYDAGIFKLSGGVSGFYGERSGDSDKISKNNLGAHLKPSFEFGAHTISIGGGVEKISYAYKPSAASENSKTNFASSQEIGYNYALNPNTNLFASYVNGYLAPDIDRFFNWGGSFNALIDKEESKSFTIGGGYYTKNNKLKISLFYIRLKNEIYYNPDTWSNTNIDKSSKRGFEISDKLALSDTLSLYGAYSYVDAKIDSEAGISGKSLPGVPKHSVSVSAFYAPTNALKLSLSHTHKSKTYKYDDFANSSSLKQKAYDSTDAKIAYSLKNIELFATASNIFGVKNALYTNGSKVYPTEFNTLYTFGANVKF